MKAKKAPCQNPLRSAGGHLESDQSNTVMKLDDVWYGYTVLSSDMGRVRNSSLLQDYFWLTYSDLTKCDIFQQGDDFENRFILNFLFWPQHFWLNRFLILVMGFLDVPINKLHQKANLHHNIESKIQEVWEMIHLISGWITVTSGMRIIFCKEIDIIKIICIIAPRFSLEENIVVHPDLGQPKKSWPTFLLPRIVYQYFLPFLHGCLKTS